MKKFTKKLTFAVVMVLTLALFFSVFVACNNNTDPDPDKDPGTTVTPGGDTDSGDDGSDDGQTPVNPDEGGDDQGSETPAFAFPAELQGTWYTSEGYEIVISENTLTYDEVECNSYAIVEKDGVTYYNFSDNAYNYGIYKDGDAWYFGTYAVGVLRGAEELLDTMPSEGGDEDPTPAANTLTVGSGNVVTASNEGEGWYCMPATEYTFTAPTAGTYTISSDDSKFVVVYDEEWIYSTSTLSVTLNEGQTITIVFGNNTVDEQWNLVADEEASYEVTVEKLEEIPAVFIGTWTGVDGDNNTVSYTITSSSVMDSNWVTWPMNKIVVSDNQLTISAANTVITYNDDATITVVKGSNTYTLSKGTASGGDEGDGDDTPSTSDPIALALGENTVNANATGVLYKFTATEEGVYIVSCTDDNCFIYEINNLIDWIYGDATSQSIELAEGDSITIKCASDDETDDSYVVTITLSTDSGDDQGSETPGGGDETPSEGGDETTEFAFPADAQKTWYTSDGDVIVVSANTLTFNGSDYISNYFTSKNTDGSVTYYRFSTMSKSYAIYTDGTDWYLAETSRNGVDTDNAVKLLTEAPEGITSIPDAFIGTWKYENITVVITSTTIVDETNNINAELSYKDFTISQEDGVYTIYDAYEYYMLTDNGDGTLEYTYIDIDNNENEITLTKVTESAE